MFKFIKEYSVKSKAERQLKAVINEVYKNPSLEFDQQLFVIGKGHQLSIDSALYLFGKDLIDIPVPYEFRLVKKSYSYFTDKRRKFIDIIILRIALPSVVSIITTWIISSMKSN